MLCSDTQPFLKSVRGPAPQRPIFLREYSTGTYTILPYLASKMLVEGPLLFAQCAAQALCTYWLIGFNGNFMLLTLIWWMLR